MVPCFVLGSIGLCLLKQWTQQLVTLAFLIPLPLLSTPAASAAAAASASPSSSTTAPASSLAPIVAVIAVIGRMAVFTADSLCEGVGFRPESTWY